MASQQSRRSKGKRSGRWGMPGSLSMLLVLVFLTISSVVFLVLTDYLDHDGVGPTHFKDMFNFVSRWPSQTQERRAAAVTGFSVEKGVASSVGNAFPEGVPVSGAVLLQGAELPPLPHTKRQEQAVKKGFDEKVAAIQKGLDEKKRLDKKKPADMKGLDEKKRLDKKKPADMKEKKATKPSKPDQSGGHVVDKWRGRAVAAALTDVASSAKNFSWERHTGRSCQTYANGDAVSRSLEASKKKCQETDACVAVECGAGNEAGGCTIRAVANLVKFKNTDCYVLVEAGPSARIHPAYNSLLKEYPFQQVSTQAGNQVNIMLVRAQVNDAQYKLYQKYKDEILFLGISSMNDYPLKGKNDNPGFDYLGMFPGFLHMMRDPEKHFPPHVKTLLMSQSDFNLPWAPARDYSVPKKYDFTFSASDCDVESDGRGWCGWSKNWTFVKEALKVMCGEMNLTGVLVATKNKAATKAYTIPKSCEGKMIQTTYLAKQQDFFNYLKNSRFSFLPQIHDASPRVSTQALAFDVPILMNKHISGGWKYINNQTGEFFHDMSDFKEQLTKILRNADIKGRYEPRKWVLKNYGNPNSGKRLLEFVKTNFGDRVKLPKNTQSLLI